VVFGAEEEPFLLDASRGAAGDPADDVSCMAMNYLFFALERPVAWHRALGKLWHRFWSGYLDATGDQTLLAVAPPFLAWRGLVLANPVWYPAVAPEARDALLTLVEASLRAGQIDPAMAEEAFR
jgi:hypothetical protein